jgi:hypothetical protein
MGFSILAILAGWCLLSVVVGLSVGRVIHLMSVRAPGPLRLRRLRPRRGRLHGQRSGRLWALR